MSANWPRVPLGEVLHRSGVRVRLSPNTRYREVTVKLWGKGVILRREVDGIEIAATDRFRCSANQFILSRIDARNGAFGLVPPELDGAIVTNDFPLFDVDSEKLDPRFLAWLARTADFVELCKAASEGTTNRVRLKEDTFLATPIALPPPAEQRRIVARVDAIADRVAAARELKVGTNRDCQRFWKVLSRMSRSTAYPVTPLSKMALFLDGKRVPLSESQRVLRKGKYPYYGASGIIDYIDGYLFDGELLLLSEDGANLINRSTPIAFSASGKYWVNNHAHVLQPLESVADLHFLRYALSDYDVSVFNFASAQAKLNQRNAQQISFPLPPLPEQRRIVAHLDALQAKSDALKALQAESAAELDALLPAVLAKAFAGEL